MKVKGPEKQTANGYGDSGFARCLLFLWGIMMVLIYFGVRNDKKWCREVSRLNFIL